MPAPTTFYLLRHAETASNRTGQFVGQLDSPLTERGAQQAEEAAERLAPLAIDFAFASSLGRAARTAEIICDRLALPLRLSDDLREMCFGPWQGQKIKACEEEWPEQFQHFRNAPESFDLTGAERFADLQARLVGALERIAHEHPGKDVLVVSHGVAIKVLLLHFQGRPLSDLAALTTPHNCAFVTVSIPDDSNAGPSN